MSIVCQNCEKRITFRRGVCAPCYVALCKGVREKKYNWEELEAQGKIQPAQTRRERSRGLWKALWGANALPDKEEEEDG